MCVVVMDMVGWMGAVWSWCLLSMRGQSQVVGRMSGDAGAFQECVGNTRSYHHPGAQFWVGSSRNWSVFLERPNTGRHEKAPARCPCSRLVALHGAPRTHVVSLSKTLYSYCFSRFSSEMGTRWGEPREGCSVL